MNETVIGIGMGLVVVGLSSTLLMRRLNKSPSVIDAHAFAARFSMWCGFLVFAVLAFGFFIQMQPNPSHGNSLLLMLALIGLPALGIGTFGVIMPLLFWGRLIWMWKRGSIAGSAPGGAGGKEERKQGAA